MTVGPSGSTLPIERGPLPTLDAAPMHLHVSTVDSQGRVALRGTAQAMGWSTGHALALTALDGVLRIHLPTAPFRSRAGSIVTLDNRWRVLLPYGLRVYSGWDPGIRLMVVAAPSEGVAAALTVARIASALLDGP